jgi:hypothetical protein
MVLRVGEYEVLHSGTVISYETEPITFEISPEIIIRIVFKSDPSKADSQIEFDSVSNSQLDINLVNVSPSIGVSNVSPLNLGHFNGRKLYLNFSVFSVGPTENLSRTLHYTWYTRELTH